MIRLCLIITGLSTGGAEMMLLKLLQRLDRTRFSPEVISLTSQGEIGLRLQALGIPVTALGMRPGWVNFLGFCSLVRHLRRHSPDAVHTWMYHADLLGGLAARLAGVRALAWGIHHSNLIPEHNKRGTLLVIKICAWLSHCLPRRVFVCSEQALRVHVGVGYAADKMTFVPNGFDLVRFTPDAGARVSVRAELGLYSETLLVGVIARDDPLKNHAGFVQAAAEVKAVLPACHFVFAGQGIDEQHSALVQMIERAGLQDCVHLLGRRDDVPRLMAALDVLASPSHGEAFPNVLGEAMACEVPCVVTDVGDSAEIVGDTGRVVEPSDMSALADQIVSILRLPPEQRQALGAKARLRVTQRYELDDVTRRYENLYCHLLSDN